MSLKPKPNKSPTKAKSRKSLQKKKQTFKVNPQAVDFLINRFGDTKTSAIFTALEKEGVHNIYGADSVSSTYGESRILVDNNIGGGEVFYYWDGHAAHEAAVRLVIEMTEETDIERGLGRMTKRDARRQANALVSSQGFEDILESDGSRLINLGNNGYILWSE